MTFYLPRFVRTKGEYEAVMNEGGHVVAAFMGSGVAGDTVRSFSSLGQRFTNVAFMGVMDGSEACTLLGNPTAPAFKIFKDGDEVKTVSSVDDLIKELEEL